MIRPELSALKKTYFKDLPNIEKNPLPRIHNVLLLDVAPTIGMIFDLYTQESSMSTVKMSCFLSSEIADECPGGKLEPMSSIVPSDFPSVVHMSKNPMGNFPSPSPRRRDSFSLGDLYPPSPIKSKKSYDMNNVCDDLHLESPRLTASQLKAKNSERSELGLNKKSCMGQPRDIKCGHGTLADTDNFNT